MKVVMNWLKLGSEVASLVIPAILSLVLVLFSWRKWILPEFEAKFSKADQTITNLAKLAGVKSQEYADGNKVAKAVGADMIQQKIPELQALKLVVGADTWTMIEELIQENPDQAMALYNKYGHLLPGNKSESQDYMF